MFRLKIPRSQFNFSFQICRNYLSNEYKSSLNGFDIPVPNANNVRSKVAAEQGIVLVDIVNGVAHNETSNNEYGQSLLKLRSVPEKATTFEATNYAILRNFVDNENIKELLPLIKNRLESGIFVDDFMGCYLLNHLLIEENYLAAAELGLEIFKQDTLENKLIVGLILRSFLEYLKQNVEQISAPVAKVTKPAKKSDEVKVRLKFVRNTEDSNNFVGDIGRAICRIAELHKNDVSANFKLFASLLFNKPDLAILLLNDKNISFCKDTLQYAQILLKNKEGVDEKLTNALDLSLTQAADSKQLDDILLAFIEAVRKDEETKLIKQQNNKYTVWKEQDVVERKKNINAIPPSQRKEHVEKILADLSLKRQKLWYFENEEAIDLEIFKKIKHYPKRWFGKKKKPKIIDDNYVPPEISRKLA